MRIRLSALSGRILLLAGLLLPACSGESFEPEGVSLSGTWLLSSETEVEAIPPGSGVTSNSCSMHNVPVTLEATDDPNLWVGQTGDGGTLQCELNGDVGDPVPYNPLQFLLVTKTGGELSLGLNNGTTVYTGELVRANRMSGAVTGDLDGRVGTWTGVRQ
jgi:hypothetical protein